MSDQEQINALAVLTSLDAEQIRETIAAKEQELAELCAGHQREIDALKILLRAAGVRDNGDGRRKPRGPKTSKAKEHDGAPAIPPSPLAGGTVGSPAARSLAQRVIDYLRVAGPFSFGAIGQGVKMDGRTIAGLCKRDARFHYDENRGQVSLAN